MVKIEMSQAIIRQMELHFISYNILMRVFDEFPDKEHKKRFYELIEEEIDNIMLEDAHMSFMRSG